MVRNPHAGQPFTTSDEEIAEALLDVSIPTLMLSLVHMSGDPALIRGDLRPAGLFLNEVQGYMSEEDKAAARKIALEVIADYRDRGCPEPEPIGAASERIPREPVHRPATASFPGADLRVDASSLGMARASWP